MVVAIVVAAAVVVLILSNFLNLCWALLLSLMVIADVVAVGVILW